MEGERGIAPVNAYSGKTHRPLPRSRTNLRDDHWSTACVGREDIAELLGTLRKFKPKNKPKKKSG
jgi:hypothetical protein